MPIRMTDDQPEEQSQYDGNDNRGGGGGGFSGGGGLLSLLPLLFGLFRSKMGILLLIVGGIAYFMLGRGGCNTGVGGIVNNIGQLATGGKLDPREFEESEYL